MEKIDVQAIAQMILDHPSKDVETVLRRVIDLLADKNEFILEDIAHYVVSLLAATH